MLRSPWLGPSHESDRMRFPHRKKSRFKTKQSRSKNESNVLYLRWGLRMPELPKCEIENITLPHNSEDVIILKLRRSSPGRLRSKSWGRIPNCINACSEYHGSPMESFADEQYEPTIDVSSQSFSFMVIVGFTVPASRRPIC